MTARLLAAVALLAGVALGAVRRSEPPAAPPAADGYVVLAADLHVHGWPDGIPPWDAVREAARRRLDVVALTAHNSTRLWWLWTHAPWARAGGVIVLPGEELTSVGYHMAIVGVTEGRSAENGIQQIAAGSAGWRFQFRFAFHAGWSRVPER